LCATLVAYFTFAQSPEVVVSTGHTNQVNSISISDDGKFIATGSGDKTIKIIETATGKELRTIANNNQRISVVKFDKTTSYIGAHQEGESLRIYDIATGEMLSEFLTNVEEFDFCLDDKKVVFIDLDNNLCVGDVLTGEVSALQEITGPQRMRVSTLDDSRVVILNYKAEVQEIDLKSGQILRSVQLFEELRYATCRFALSPDEKHLVIAYDEGENGKNGTAFVYDYQSFKLKGKLKGHKTRIFDMIFSKQSGHLLTTSHDHSTKVWDVNKMKEITTLTLGTFSSMALEVHPFEEYFLQGDMSKIYYVNEKTGEVVKTFEALGNSIVHMAYDQIGNYLVTAGVNISLKIWDLEQNKIKRSIMGFWPVAFSPDAKDLVAMYNGIALAVWNPSTGKQKQTLDTENELIQKITYNPDGKLLAGAGFLGIIKIWDMKTYKMTKKMIGHVGGIYGLCFSPDSKQLASCGMDNTVRIWDVESGKELHKIAEEDAIIVSDVKYSPDGKLLAASSWDQKIRVYNTSDWSLKYTLEGHTNMITTIDFSADGRFLASGAGNNAVHQADNSVIIWDVSTGAEHCRYKGHKGMIQKVIFDKLSTHVYSTGDDGTVRVWDYQNCEEVALMASVGDDDYVIATPDNYYMSSKDALDAVSFRIGKKLYPFEQFDLKLNRPDIISSRLGKTPQGLINAYQYVYKKRLRKMGFDEDQLGDDFHLPVVKIETKTNVFTTTEKTFELTAFAEDEKYKLDRLNVYVNDVPIYGLKGFDLSDLDANSVRKDIAVELVEGKNKIQVSVHNASGVESLRETYELVYNGTVEKSDLYLITIGVSEYANEKFNLKYAAKDARDVMTEISKSEHLYKEVKSKILVDSEVTKENILALKNFLADATEDDAVIIFVAGHGLLDENLDYYYATHDVNFDNPSEGGVSYDLLEELIAAVRAYQKLLIMDTCHSGELDKEEVEAAENEDVRLGDVEFRAVAAGVRQKEGFGFENAGELMETMFVDVRKGTGATVISSAGGAEFAMESAEWKNGLFTYCLLNGLTSKKADQNFDGAIHVSELRAYVYDEVTKLSGGKQKPTARAENLSIDYRVW
jgi:WD40 repeat protein